MNDKLNFNCNLCPNFCNVDRRSKKGACGSGDNLSISKYGLHYYEEPVISGTNGSGTVFFTGCGLRCAFCQNYELSRVLRGKTISHLELVDIFKSLEEQGAHNINLVTPSHYVKQIAKAFEIYKPSIPIVYNTHSYETLESLEIIAPYVDIYLPDLKFYSPDISKRYTNKENYFETATTAISYMLNAKKTVIENGLIKSGVIVRHLILPLCVSDSKKIINWFYENQKNGAYLSIMSQYTPLIKNENLPELNRKITSKEYNAVVDYALSKGLENVFIQNLSSASEEYVPKWDY